MKTKSATLLSLVASFIMGYECPADIVGYWRFEENGGGIAHDETGFFDGELISFVSTAPGGGDSIGEGWSASVASTSVPLTGEPNTGSIRFGGGAGYIDLSNAYTMNLGSEFTIEFYMNPSTDSIIAPMFGFSSGSELSFLMADIGSEPFIRGEFQGEIDGPFSATLVTNGTWQHFALVMETNDYSVYIDGQLQYNGVYPGGASGPYEFTGNVALGTRTIGGPTGTWDGYIDEFRISDTALTPDQFLIVPEPSTISLLLVGVAGMLWRRKRRG